MSFQIHDDESLGIGIQRAVQEEIEAAVEACSAKQLDNDTPVHETRRRLKRARAALHLLRGEVARKELCGADRQLQKVGRVISSIRDAEVRLATINDLRRAFGSGRGSNLEETEELLAFELDSFLAAFDGWQDEAADKLRRTQGAIAEWQVAGIPSARILRNLKRSYKRGCKALKLVKKKTNARNFHTLRKRSKELWLQLRLLRPLEPGMFKELRCELKKLGSDLGHAHDLCFVAERLRDLAGMHPRQHSRKMLAGLVKSRERDLQGKALRVAQRFYHEKPKKFASRLRPCFKKWLRPNECKITPMPTPVVARRHQRVGV